MSPCFEFEGKSVEKAVKKACDELNMPKEELQHDIISYGSTGIFGLVGSRKARIRVTVPEPPPEPESKSGEKTKSSKPFREQAIEVSETLKTIETHECEPCFVSDDPKTVGLDALQRIVDLITADAKIQAGAEGGRIVFNIKGGNSAVLIGKRGQTLEAVQYLVEKIINKRREERIHVQVDVEGYMQNRRANLQKLAERLAEKAQMTGKPAKIGQMNAYDRRIVHLALKDNSAVRTQSMGEGYLRKLVIFPKKTSFRKKRPD
ncbi:MAG: RNA-binding cell elongation regulator Jag/EloR [Pseudomonadota bacterium]|nr:Jag N-terminal domain-containing protein [Pseudomonadota bacterium]